MRAIQLTKRDLPFNVRDWEQKNGVKVTQIGVEFGHLTPIFEENNQSDIELLLLTNYQKEVKSFRIGVTGILEWDNLPENILEIRSLTGDKYTFINLAYE